MLQFVKAVHSFKFLIENFQLTFFLCIFVVLFLKVFINERGNVGASKAMENVHDYVNGSSALSVTLNIEFVDGASSEAKKFLENCEYRVEYHVEFRLIS